MTLLFSVIEYSSNIAFNDLWTKLIMVEQCLVGDRDMATTQAYVVVANAFGGQVASSHGSPDSKTQENPSNSNRENNWRDKNNPGQGGGQ